MVVINKSNTPLIDVLKQYVTDNEITCDFNFRFSYGIDFAECAVILPSGEKRRVYMAVEDRVPKGTARNVYIEETEFTRQYVTTATAV